ncbi:MAG TPA: serine hydroxymethyltransferase [Candidatus Thermoplasmatota archaeon]|nr:serine hydroxymethyltransferase [Candidatus Thermoplasmatota archaeon]
MNPPSATLRPLEAADAVRAAAKRSTQLFRDGLPMIASENIVSPRVAEMLVTDLHGRYAEGLPGKRYYQGCQDFDTIEALGMQLAQSVFRCRFANIQSTSGTVSNLAVLKSLSKPGDAITAVNTADGGHISHAPMGAVGMRGLELHTYPWDIDRMEPDLDGSLKLIRTVKPRLAWFGQSMFLFPTPMKELAAAAHEVGSTVVYDGAHVLGLIGGGQFQDPLREGADVLTGSSHKTFPGPQGGFVLSDTADEKLQRKLHSGVFPGVVSSYHLHHVAGKVVALAEFQEYGAQYAKDTVANAQALGAALAEQGFDVLAADRGFTKSHQVVTRHGAIDSGAGKQAAATLEEAGIITNMNMLPGDTKATNPSGVRIGVQELTRVGMGRREMEQVAGFYGRALLKGEDPKKVKADVKAFKARFQAVKYCFNPDDLGGYEFYELARKSPMLAPMA